MFHLSFLLSLLCIHFKRVVRFSENLGLCAEHRVMMMMPSRLPGRPNDDFLLSTHMAPCQRKATSYEHAVVKTLIMLCFQLSFRVMFPGNTAMRTKNSAASTAAEMKVAEVKVAEPCSGRICEGREPSRTAIHALHAAQLRAMETSSSILPIVVTKDSARWCWWNSSAFSRRGSAMPDRPAFWEAFDRAIVL